MSLDKEKIVQSVPQKGFLAIQKDYLRYFSLSSGSAFPIME